MIIVDSSLVSSDARSPSFFFNEHCSEKKNRKKKKKKKKKRKKKKSTVDKCPIQHTVSKYVFVCEKSPISVANIAFTVCLQVLGLQGLTKTVTFRLTRTL